MANSTKTDFQEVLMRMEQATAFDFIIKNFFDPFNKQIEFETMKQQYGVLCNYSLFTNPFNKTSFVFTFYEFPDKDPIYYQLETITEDKFSIEGTTKNTLTYVAVAKQNRTLFIGSKVETYMRKHEERLVADRQTFFKVLSYKKEEAWEEEIQDKNQFVKDFKRILLEIKQTTPEVFIKV